MCLCFPSWSLVPPGWRSSSFLGRGWCDIQHNYQRLRAKQWTICRVIERQLDSRDFQNSTVLQQIILSVAIHWVLWLLVLKEWPFFLHVQTASAGSPFGSLKTPAQHTLTMLNPKPIGLNYIYIPSGKRLHNYGKSPCLMGKSTINGHFQ